jgi:hypothetical protein
MTGAVDPLLLALALIVIQGLVIASLVGWIVWRDGEPRIHDFNDSAGLAIRPDADGGRPTVPSWFVAISNFFRGGRHA